MTDTEKLVLIQRLTDEWQGRDIPLDIFCVWVRRILAGIES